MKIFVLGTRGFPGIQGGVEKHCEELYPRLVKLGCEVTVVTRKPYLSKIRRVREWKGVNFVHLWCLRVKEIEAITHTFLGLWIARIKSPDILHLHAIGPSIFTPLAKLLGLKVVVTNHGPDYVRQKWGKFAKFILKLGEVLSTKFADKVIVISETIKTSLIKLYGRQGLELIYNGVSIPQKVNCQETLKKYGLESKKYVFTTCRFVPEKGLHDLIDAYLKIDKPEFKLVISGGADHETHYSCQLKEKAKGSERIILTGFVSGKPLQELYSHAGLFVLPSHYEGLPISLLEAMSYDLPILASDIPQNRKLPLEDFRFYPPADVDVLAKKMEEMFRFKISEEEKAKQRRILEENYDWDKIALQTFEVYKSVVKSG
ncbi:MAG: glycosyltransferase family 4 protein [Candidatus Edwardsbacteria bacterium]